MIWIDINSNFFCIMNQVPLLLIEEVYHNGFMMIFQQMQAYKLSPMLKIFFS